MMLRILILLVALLMTVGRSAVAIETPSQKQQSVVTNGELTAGKEFHLLLIHDGGQLSIQVAGMLSQPRGPLVDWVRSSNVRLMYATEPQVMEHHADLMQKHQGQMPILAMIQQTADDGRGAVWCSAAGAQIPTTELAMASWLATYYQATLNASQRANQLPTVAGPRVVQQSNLQQRMPTNNGGGGSYFMPRGGAPGPYQPGGQMPRSQVDVQINSGEPQSDPMTAEAQMMIFAAVLAIVCCVLLGASPIISAVIIGHAITDDDDRPQTQPTQP